MHFETIIVPTDLSNASRAAIDPATALARRFEARLLLLHVFEDIPIGDAGPTGRVFLELGRHRERAFRRCREILEDQAEDLRQDLTVDVEVVRGDPTTEILRHGGESGDRLICLSSQGRTGWAVSLIGSVAESVASVAECPVLTCRGDGRRVNLVPRRILCATDFSHASLGILGRTARLAQVLGAETDFFYVRDDSWLHFFLGVAAFPAAASGKYTKQTDRDIETLLRTQVEERVPEGFEFGVEIGRGVAYQEVLRRAGEGYDLLVIGTHPYSGLKYAALGSVARRIVRHAELPVLTLHVSEDREQP